MKDIQLAEMLKAGLHFGHKTSKWHPNMKKYIFGVRNGVHIIDLEKSLAELNRAREFSKGVAAKGGKILFVGTKRQAKNVVVEAATSCGMPYVNGRWLGGTFTNFKVIITQTKRLLQLEEQQRTGELAKYTKKEQLEFQQEIEKLRKNFGGLVTLNKVPEAIIVADVHDERIAIREAKTIGIPIIAITDSNTDPELVDYPIPANDDAITGLHLILSALAEAITEGSGNFKPTQEDEQKQAVLGKVKEDAAPAAPATPAPTKS
jgi:small subunit ribosomal protein S2